MRLEDALSVIMAPEAASASTSEDKGIPGVARVVIISGLLGFFVGAVLTPTWHHAIESAQVVSGIVTYPRENPFYMYHTKVWTLYIQACSLLLYCGVPDRAIAFAVSGLLGTLSYQALALCAFVLSRNTILSVGSSLLTHMLWRGWGAAGVYPLVITGAHFSYGMMGLSYALLVLALHAAGKNRPAAFMLGMAPAIHVVLGLFSWLVVFTCLLWDLASAKERFRAMVRPFFIGCSVAAASLGYHSLATYDVPRMPKEEYDRYVDVFLRFWHVHQSPILPTRPEFALNLAVTGISFVWAEGSRTVLPSGKRFLLRGFFVAGAVSTVLAGMTWLPRAFVPDLIQISIPARFLNFDLLALIPLFIGLLTLRKGSKALFTVLLFFIAPLVLYAFHLREAERFAWALLLVAATLLLVIGRPWEIDVNAKDQVSGTTLRAEPLLRVLRLIMSVILVALLAFGYFWRHHISEFNLSVLRNWQSDSVLAAVHSSDRGLIAGNSIPLLQLMTCRPVLMDPNVNMLGYVPEAGPQIAGILKEVYDTDMFDPPRGKYEYGMLDRALFKDAWERRSVNEWIEIRKKFGVTHVVCLKGWELNLPLIADNGWFRAYVIPLKTQETPGG